MDSELTGTVLSVFHMVSTDIQGLNNVMGALILAKSGQDFIFWWRGYPSPKVHNVSQAPPQDIILKTSNIQKIMVNYQEKEGYLLITTSQAMHQFIFPKAASFQLLHFIQLISINQQQPSGTLESSVNFAAESFVATQSHFRLYDMTVEHSQVSIPPDFISNGSLQQKVTVVQSDLHIMSQFNIHSDDYTKNPIAEPEFLAFSSISDLRTAVRMRGVAPSIRHKVWPVLFDVLPFSVADRPNVLKERTAEYIRTRKQWESMSKTQLKFMPSLKDSFATIRVDVKRTRPPDAIAAFEGWSEILVRLLRTFSIWNLDVHYTQGLNDLGVNFLTIFLPKVPSEMSLDEAESMAFWCFAAFVEMIGSGLIAENMMTMQQRELHEIMAIIDQFHPACANWLRANGLGDLSFLISPFILAYGRSFASADIARVWEALICFEAPWLFLRYFSATLLIFSFPSVALIPNCSTGKLVSILDEIFFKQDMGSLIGVSLSMMKNSKAEMADEIRKNKGKSERDFDGFIGKKWFFCPKRDHFDQYRAFKELFI